ncbi:hypothetical protein F5Y12DRAFT_798300 [Xylaria sp. FL1777]|nr:hypothetical protein F5Y12DRAFT_798300 [Xylaria sp. FL1777]
MASVSIDKFDDSVVVGLVWSWQCCDGCKASRRCQSSIFQSHNTRSKRYPFKTHGDIWKAISLLTHHPELTRVELSELISASSLVPVDHKLSMDATALIVKIVCMIDCSSLHYSPGRLEEGNSRPFWGDQVPFNKYLQDLFTTQSHPAWPSRYGQNETLYARKTQLRTTKLMKHLNLKFYPTHDIRDHLRLDLRHRELHVFHYDSFLKENLRAKNSSYFNLINCRDLLPKQLLLEILDSIRLLRSPISNSDYSFDPETDKFELSTVCNAGEENASYIYLANQLKELFQGLRNPQPRTWLEKQMQRRSGARYSKLPQLHPIMNYKQYRRMTV